MPNVTQIRFDNCGSGQTVIFSRDWPISANDQEHWMLLRRR